MSTAVPSGSSVDQQCLTQNPTVPALPEPGVAFSLVFLGSPSSGFLSREPELRLSKEPHAVLLQERNL